MVRRGHGFMLLLLSIAMLQLSAWVWSSPFYFLKRKAEHDAQTGNIRFWAQFWLVSGLRVSWDSWNDSDFHKTQPIHPTSVRYKLRTQPIAKEQTTAKAPVFKQRLSGFYYSPCLAWWQWCHFCKSSWIGMVWQTAALESSSVITLYLFRHISNRICIRR